MKYRELIQFEPLKEVIKFNLLDEEQYREKMVSSYVFSEFYENTIISEICKNLDYTSSNETFGMQIVGTYGTGKSHLMSLFSLIAENKDYLSLVNSEIAKKALEKIAGKYKVVRFELGATQELWDLVCFQIDNNLNDWGVEYSISADKQPDMYKDKLGRMMAQFEKAYPNKGLMIVIDEMLSYLRGRSGNDSLNRDLGVLQALGEFSDSSKFRMVFGVQELIYNVPEFQFAAKMLNQVSHRYRQFEITKQDIKFVTERRMLKKTDEQKSIIRKHLEKFTKFFPDIHANLEEYVNLFPVNPSFFDNFQQIRVAKSQREILKTLSSKFETIADKEVPITEPGLVCYDSYWDDLNVAAMKTISDIERISGIMGIISSKINDNFIGARERKKTLAQRIANACAIKILQDDLGKTNGVSAESLVDDLCYVEEGCINRKFLIDVIDTTAQQVVKATAGQYFEKNNTNQEFHLRVEGGVNYEQKIKDFVGTMTPSNMDSYFLSFLVEYIFGRIESYRPGFKIYDYHIEWMSHKVMLDGYIFMGNPSERSTTQPEQKFYIYFMPIFNEDNKKHGDEPDSVYFHLDKVSEEMKELLGLYAASDALMASVDSTQKQFYERYKNKYLEKLRPVFDNDFNNYTEVVYQGNIQNINPSTMKGDTKEEIISNIASAILENHFCQSMENYPKFTLLPYSLTKQNRGILLKNARQKIADPIAPNHNGEAILSGLGLMKENQLSIEGSIYALSIQKRLRDKGEGRVLNRNEILYKFYEKWAYDWRSNDYNIEADIEFIVLSVMVALGEIDINIDDNVSINAANIKKIIDLPDNNFYDFSNICRPKEVNSAAIYELFMGLTGRNMITQIEDESIYYNLINSAQKMASDAAICLNILSEGLNIHGLKLLDDDFSRQARIQLLALKNLCERIPNYASRAKIKHLPKEWTAEVLHERFAAKNLMEKIERSKNIYQDIRSRINYLYQATQYIPDGDLNDKIISSIKQIELIINNGVSDSEIRDYITQLDSLKKSYVNWYLKEYKRQHITEFQDEDKKHILSSPQNNICKVIYQTDNINKYLTSFVDEYHRWQEFMNQLNVGDVKIDKNSLENTPYADFDPRLYVGKNIPKLEELKEDLEDIYNCLEDTLIKILKDEKLLVNMEILNNEQRNLLTLFNNGKVGLSENNAAMLYEIICKLHQKFTAVTIYTNEIHNILNRPMTPEDAIEAFRKYIEGKCSNKNKNNIRIFLK